MRLNWYQSPKDKAAAADRRRITRLLAQAQGGLCFWCGFEVAFGLDAALTLAQAEAPHRTIYQQKAAAKKMLASFEHLIPESQGGGITIANGACACAQCNQQRDKMSIDDARTYFRVLLQNGVHWRQVYRRRKQVYGGA